MPAARRAASRRLLRLDRVARVLGRVHARLEHAEPGQRRRGHQCQAGSHGDRAAAPAEQRCRCRRPPPAARSTSASCPAVPWCSGSAATGSIRLSMYFIAAMSPMTPSTAMRPGRAGLGDRSGDHRQPARGQARRADEDERQVAVGGVPGRDRGVGQQHRGVDGQRRREHAPLSARGSLDEPQQRAQRARAAAARRSSGRSRRPPRRRSRR